MTLLVGNVGWRRNEMSKSKDSRSNWRIKRDWVVFEFDQRPRGLRDQETPGRATPKSGDEQEESAMQYARTQ